MKTTDRVTVFKELSLNDLNNVDSIKAENLLGDYYDEFNAFCNFLQNGITEIHSTSGEVHPIVNTVSCDFSDTGVRFEMHMENGETQEVIMSKNREAKFVNTYKK